MTKYNREVIVNYIFGNDLGKGYSIGKLENNSEFMKEVLLLSKDKNFYNLCSNRVKKNYEFVKAVVMNFNKDVDFIVKVSENYLNSSKNKLNNIELLIILCQYLDKNGSLYLIYKSQIDNYLDMEIFSASMAAYRNVLKRPELKELLGNGFCFLHKKYGSREIILDYMAKQSIENILGYNLCRFEDHLHNRFSKFESFEKIGITKYLVEYLEVFDELLSSYVLTNIKLLTDTKEKLKLIKENWDEYNKKVEDRRYKFLLEVVHIYMKEEAHFTTLDEKYLLYFIGNELRINDKIFKYDNISHGMYESILNYISKLKVDEFSFPDLKIYYKLKPIIINVLTGKYTKRDLNKYIYENLAFGSVINFKRK